MTDNTLITDLSWEQLERKLVREQLKCHILGKLNGWLWKITRIHKFGFRALVYMTMERTIIVEAHAAYVRGLQDKMRQEIKDYPLPDLSDWTPGNEK